MFFSARNRMNVYSEHCTQDIVNNRTQCKQAQLTTMLQHTVYKMDTFEVIDFRVNLNLGTWTLWVRAIVIITCSLQWFLIITCSHQFTLWLLNKILKLKQLQQRNTTVVHFWYVKADIFLKNHPIWSCISRCVFTRRVSHLTVAVFYSCFILPDRKRGELWLYQFPKIVSNVISRVFLEITWFSYI